MATITENYFAKLTKDWLLADSVQEMDRINSITKVILNLTNPID